MKIYNVFRELIFLHLTPLHSSSSHLFSFCTSKISNSWPLLSSTNSFPARLWHQFIFKYILCVIIFLAVHCHGTWKLVLNKFLFSFRLPSFDITIFLQISIFVKFTSTNPHFILGIIFFSLLRELRFYFVTLNRRAVVC
jgi:hypothetical protein